MSNFRPIFLFTQNNLKFGTWPSIQYKQYCYVCIFCSKTSAFPHLSLLFFSFASFFSKNKQKKNKNNNNSNVLWLKTWHFWATWKIGLKFTFRRLCSQPFIIMDVVKFFFFILFMYMYSFPFSAAQSIRSKEWRKATIWWNHPTQEHKHSKQICVTR